jgi:hypothetical protein
LLQCNSLLIIIFHPKEKTDSYCKRNLLPILEKNLGEEKAGLARTLAVATSAAVGNASASASRVPYEVVKQELQGGEYTYMLEALRLMFQQPNLMRAVQYCTQEKLN